MGQKRHITLIVAAAWLLWSIAADAHHWVRDIYDAQKRFIAVVEVKKFLLINPHPHLQVEITAFPSGSDLKDVTIGQTWTLEMDNKRELTALGIDNETFVPGDKIIVAVDPSRTTLYRKNTLYLRAVEHERQGFIYLHNVRQLFDIDPGGDSLSNHLHKIR